MYCSNNVTLPAATGICYIAGLSLVNDGIGDLAKVKFPIIIKVDTLGCKIVSL